MSYRRSVFLINKRFQVRFAFYVCSWLFALSLVYPLIIYSVFDFILRNAQQDPMGPAISAIRDMRKDVLILLALLQLLFTGVTFLISIFISHRIAGPLHKLRLFMGDVREGNLAQELHFRKKDHFHDLAEDFNAMVHGVRRAMIGQTDNVASAIHQLEKVIDGQAGADKKIRQELETTIGLLREAQKSVEVVPLPK